MLIRGRHLAALHACALAPAGVRCDVYPGVVPALLRLGFIEVERASQPASLFWLTRTGWDVLRMLAVELPRRP